ncbi:proline-rich protein 2-like [Cinclus cinclus]|uniref:proline-rich protein 2-like n=1 Tax=Cinclus cinclus TaxID=127875 RepID=UPI002E12E5F6
MPAEPPGSGSVTPRPLADSRVAGHPAAGGKARLSQRQHRCPLAPSSPAVPLTKGPPADALPRASLSPSPSPGDVITRARREVTARRFSPYGDQAPALPAATGETLSRQDPVPTGPCPDRTLSRQDPRGPRQQQQQSRAGGAPPEPPEPPAARTPPAHLFPPLSEPFSFSGDRFEIPRGLPGALVRGDAGSG